MRCEIGLALGKELDDFAFNTIAGHLAMSDESLPYELRLERRNATHDQYEKLREAYLSHVTFCID